jgi:hypothetical protein
MGPRIKGLIGILHLQTAKGSGLSDRRKVAADAKIALVERYRAAMAAAEPDRAAKQADRQAVSSAREGRRAERDRLKTEETERVLAEAAEQAMFVEAEALAAEQARKADGVSRLAKVLADEVTRKAERDRRYANRKARKA